MAVYKCDVCEMSVEVNCAKCGTPLQDGSISLDGNEVRVSKCPNGHGMIKSPLCCGKDMACTS